MKKGKGRREGKRGDRRAEGGGGKDGREKQWEEEGRRKGRELVSQLGDILLGLHCQHQTPETRLLDPPQASEASPPPDTGVLPTLPPPTASSVSSWLSLHTAPSSETRP